VDITVNYGMKKAADYASDEIIPGFSLQRLINCKIL